MTCQFDLGELVLKSAVEGFDAFSQHVHLIAQCRHSAAVFDSPIGELGIGRDATPRLAVLATGLRHGADRIPQFLVVDLDLPDGGLDQLLLEKISP